MEPDQKPCNCEEVLAALSDYLNLDLPRESCRQIEEHLAGCPSCVEFAETLRETVRLCRQYKPSELPAPLGEEVKRQLREAYQRVMESRGGSGGH